MFCAYCAQKLPEDAAFCNRCGRPVKIAAPQVNEFEEYGVYQTPWTANNSAIHYTDQGPRLSTELPMTVPNAPPVLDQQPLPALSPFQHFLVKTFQQGIAGKALFGSIFGCIVAVIASITTSGLVLLVVHVFALSTASSASSEEMLSYVLGIIPLHAPLRDTMELFLAIQGIGLHELLGTTTYTFNSPLHGLLLIPALFLTLGGYLAASTDLRNQRQRSLVRGAAIALPYTLLLLLLSWQVNGNILPSATIPTTTQNTLTVDTSTLLFFGLLWGGIFGLLGASLKLARGQWRHLLQKTLYTSPHPQIAGMLAGACWASLIGWGLSLLTICGLLAYTTLSLPLLARNLCIAGDWQTLVTWGVTQGPLHAADLFFLLLGSSIANHASLSAQQCFYTDLSRAPLTLRDQTLHLAPWVYALLLIPALSLCIGGYISAKISRAQGMGPRVISGALIAVPFTLLMLLLAFISTITISSASSGNTVPNVQSMGTNMTDLLLWALLSGACFGALGGIFQGSVVEKWGGLLLVLPRSVVEFLAMPIYGLLAQISRQRIATLRTPARSLLYGTLCGVFLLALATGGIDAWLIANNQTLTVQMNQMICNIVSVLLITLPGLFLFCAFTLALKGPAQGEQYIFTENKTQRLY